MECDCTSPGCGICAESAEVRKEKILLLESFGLLLLPSSQECKATEVLSHLLQAPEGASFETTGSSFSIVTMLHSRIPKFLSFNKHLFVYFERQCDRERGREILHLLIHPPGGHVVVNSGPGWTRRGIQVFVDRG